MDKTTLRKAVAAHTNLNTFACVQALLEGGTIYDAGTAGKTSLKIINLCKQEMQRQLHNYYAAAELLLKEQPK